MQLKTYDRAYSYRVDNTRYTIFLRTLKTGKIRFRIMTRTIAKLGG